MKRTVLAVLIGLIVILAVAAAYDIKFVQKSTSEPLGICVDKSGFTYVAASYRPALGIPAGEWLLLRKLNSSGRPVWTVRMPVSKSHNTRFYGTTSRQFPTMALDEKGNIYLAGIDVSAWLSRVTKFDSDGMHLWTRIFDFHDDMTIASLLVSQGRVCLASYFGSFVVMDGNGKALFNSRLRPATKELFSFAGFDREYALGLIPGRELDWIDLEGRIAKRIPFFRDPSMAVRTGNGSGLYVWVADMKGDPLIRKLDLSGNAVWDRTFPDKRCLSLASDPDGNALACLGDYGSPYSVNLVRISPDGQIISRQALPLRDEKQRVWVIPDRDGNALVAGKTREQWTVLKYDPSGKLLWQKTPFVLNPLEFWFARRGDIRSAGR